MKAYGRHLDRFTTCLSYAREGLGGTRDSNAPSRPEFATDRPFKLSGDVDGQSDDPAGHLDNNLR